MKTDLKIPQLSVEGKEVAENILKEFEEKMKIRAGDIIKDMTDDHLENTIRVLEKIESKTFYYEDMGAWDDLNY